MATRTDRLVAAAAVLASGSMVSGNRWATLLGALGGWGLLLWSVRAPTSERVRVAIWGGGIAALLIAWVDGIFVEREFVFHLRKEWNGVSVALGVEGVRGVLIATCLFLYTRVRARSGIVLASATTAGVGFAFGYLYEAIGATWGLWQWNVLRIPDAQMGPVWLFVPTAWGVTLLLAGYFLMPPKKRIVPAFAPVLTGIRCGAAFGAFLVLSWAMFFRFFGKAGIF